MKEQVAIQDVLQRKLLELQRQNPAYSLRAYARRLGIHAGALSHILNGKRNVSRELAERLTRRLLLDPQSRAEILGLFPLKRRYSKQGSPPAHESRYLELNAEQFKIAAEWEHFAVLSLLNCQEFQSTPEWVAARLGISLPRANQVLDRLIELGILEFDAEGALKRSPKRYRTPDDVASTSLKKHHAESLELAKESLFRDGIDVRDFTSVTMAIDPEKIPAAKELIRRQQDELSELLESGNRTEVYRFSAQLFPLSKLRSKEESTV